MSEGGRWHLYFMWVLFDVYGEIAFLFDWAVCAPRSEVPLVLCLLKRWGWFCFCIMYLGVEVGSLCLGWSSLLDQFSCYLLPPLEISDPIFSSRSDFFQSRFSFPLAHWSAWQGIPFPAQRLAAWPGFILRVSEQGSCLKIFPAPWFRSCSCFLFARSVLLVFGLCTRSPSVPEWLSSSEPKHQLVFLLVLLPNFFSLGLGWFTTVFGSQFGEISSRWKPVLSVSHRIQGSSFCSFSFCVCGDFSITPVRCLMKYV
jgi:hypothetical protein